MTKILLTTVFKPFGGDAPYNHKDSFPEVFHNRLTRAHGIFSYRGHFNAFGLHVIANNISAKSTVLEYPTLERFKHELSRGYDYVGIGSVIANFQKVKLMAQSVRELSPRTKIVIGGYCAHAEDIAREIPFDYLCTGEGISFMRELLGQLPDFRFKNPDIYSRAHSFMGVPLLGRRHPHIIVGLGCPYGCEYCSPSHHFGRRYTRFYTTGREIFREMERMEKKFHSREFSFLGEDNFLVDLNRAEELRTLVVESGRIYEIFYFSSADKVNDFGPERLAEMGTNLVWIGRESCLIPVKKTQGFELRELISRLQLHGIKVIVSSMFFMEHHTRDNIMADVEDHLRMNADFGMICVYSPMPGTPLYDRIKEEGKLLPGVPYEEWHGVGRQNMVSAYTPDEGAAFREKVLDREYRELGPSAMRTIATDYRASVYLAQSDRPALRWRGLHLQSKMPVYRVLLRAMAGLAEEQEVKAKMMSLLGEVEKTYGPTRTWEKAAAAAVGAAGRLKLKSDQKFGDRVQPPTMVTGYAGSPN